MEQIKKRVADSRAELVQVIGQQDLNGYGRLFGGRLMSWMDIVAAVSARRHSGKNVTTARVEGLEFALPAYTNDTLVLIAHVAQVGKTSMMVRVEAFVEQLNGERRLTNCAWFLLVALDESEKPTPVPALLIDTEEEKREWAQAEAVRQGFGRSK